MCMMIRTFRKRDDNNMQIASTAVCRTRSSGEIHPPLEILHVT